MNKINFIESGKKLKFLCFPVIALLYIFVSTNSVCNKNYDNVKVDTTKKQQVTNAGIVKQGEVFFQDKNKNLIKQIDVEIAETDEKRHRGLMYRQKIEENQGMLFIFQDEEEQGFYMKNTVISLDIIFINSKKKIVKIHKNTIPFNTNTLPSGKPAQYVVEVNAGFTDKYNVKEGDYIDFRRF